MRFAVTVIARSDTVKANLDDVDPDMSSVLMMNIPSSPARPMVISAARFSTG